MYLSTTSDFFLGEKKLIECPPNMFCLLLCFISNNDAGCVLSIKSKKKQKQKNQKQS